MRKISSLQAWRALFIIMICIEHMALTNKLSFFAAGGEGVTFFIVLSGFLMSYVYMNRIEDYSIKSQKEFLLKKGEKILSIAHISFIGRIITKCIGSIKE